MADLSQLLANAADTKADFDFGKLNKSYWEGLDQAYKQKQQDLFKNGVPTDAAGNVDLNAVSKTALQSGGFPALGEVVNVGKLLTQLGIQTGLQDMARNANPMPGASPRPSNLGPPSLNGSGVRADDKRNTATDNIEIEPRTIAAANAPPAPPAPQASPLVPRPVPTQSFTPQTMAPPPPPPQAMAQAPQAPQSMPPPGAVPMPQPRPPQAPPPQAAPLQASLAERMKLPPPPPDAPPVELPPISKEVEASLRASGLVPEGRTVAQQVALLSQYAAAANSTGVRDAGKTFIDRLDAIQRHIEQGVKFGNSLTEAAVKPVIERLGKSQEKMSAIADGILVSNDLRAQLDAKAGIFSGQWADKKLALAKIGNAFGLNIAPQAITNTEAFGALIGKKVAQTVKSFGSGSSITDADRDYAAKMEAGDIKLDETSIRRIIGITDKINRGLIDKHNQDVDKFVRARPETASMASSMKVDVPPQYGAPITHEEYLSLPPGRSYIAPDGSERIKGGK